MANAAERRNQIKGLLEKQSPSLSYVDLAATIADLLKTRAITRNELTWAKIEAAQLFAAELNEEVDALTIDM
jgi:hypothetical protein